MAVRMGSRALSQNTAGPKNEKKSICGVHHYNNGFNIYVRKNITDHVGGGLPILWPYALSVFQQPTVTKLR